MEIGQKIKQARESKGIKQNFLADKIGITNGHLCSIESGRYTASKTVVKLIELTLGVDLA